MYLNENSVFCEFIHSLVIKKFQNIDFNIKNHSFFYHFFKMNDTNLRAPFYVKTICW